MDRKKKTRKKKEKQKRERKLQESSPLVCGVVTSSSKFDVYEIMSLFFYTPGSPRGRAIDR